MNEKKIARIPFFAAASMAALLLLGSNAVAQSTDVHGVIDGRSGATMTVKAQETGGNVVVLLTDDTQVRKLKATCTCERSRWGWPLWCQGWLLR